MKIVLQSDNLINIIQESNVREPEGASGMLFKQAESNSGGSNLLL